MGLSHFAGHVCVVAALMTPLWPSSAQAQSSASFPPEAGGSPTPPPAAPPPSQLGPAPPPAAPPAVAPAAPPPLLPAPAPTQFEYAPAPSSPGDPRPPILPYREGLPVPPGYRVEDRPASGLMIAGATLFGVGYATALLIAFGEDFDNGSGWLALPVAGPWAAVSGRKFSCGTTTVDTTKKCVNDAFDEVRTIVFITVDGLVQATALGLMLAGATSGQQELVRNDIKLALVPPVAGQRDWRLGLSGEF